MLNGDILNVIMLKVVMLYAVILNFSNLRVIVLSVIMLLTVILNFANLRRYAECHYAVIMLLIWESLC
jgi:hypothetical protein